MPHATTRASACDEESAAHAHAPGRIGASARSSKRARRSSAFAIIAAARPSSARRDPAGTRPGAGSELFLQPVRVALAEQPGQLDRLETVRRDVGLEVTEPDRAHRAGARACRELAVHRVVRAEHALVDRALAMRDGELRGVLRERGPRRVLWLAPIERASVVGAGRHAEPAADAQLMIDEHGAVLVPERRADWTDVQAGSVLALHARARQEHRVPGLVLHLEHLDRFLIAGEMRFLAGRRALLAAVASLEVDDHRPLGCVRVVGRHDIVGERHGLTPERHRAGGDEDLPDERSAADARVRLR